MHPVLYIVIMIAISWYALTHVNSRAPGKFVWGTFTKKELKPFFDEFKRVMIPYVSFDFSHHISRHVYQTLEKCRYRIKEDYSTTDPNNNFYRFAIESTGYHERRLIVALLIYKSPNTLRLSSLSPTAEEQEAYNQIRLTVTKTIITLMDDIPPFAYEYLGLSSEEIRHDYGNALNALKLRSNI